MHFFYGRDNITGELLKLEMLNSDHEEKIKDYRRLRKYLNELEGQN
jgi:hypothetical protein